jgi:two-component system, NarL family, response regulator NreC
MVPISTVIADDHPVVRRGLYELLDREDDCEVVGEAEDGLAALDLITRLKPQVAVIDVQLPNLNGIEVARRAHVEAPETRVVMLSMYADEAYVLDALRHGALAYVLKASTTTDLIAAVHAAAAGRRYLSAPLSEHGIDEYLRRAQAADQPIDRYALLTNREREVLQLLAQELTYTEIAEKLTISPRTAETHRTNLMRKLDLKTQADLILFATKRGLIAPE